MIGDWWPWKEREKLICQIFTETLNAFWTRATKHPSMSYIIYVHIKTNNKDTLFSFVVPINQKGWKDENNPQYMFKAMSIHVWDMYDAWHVYVKSFWMAVGSNRGVTSRVLTLRYWACWNMDERELVWNEVSVNLKNTKKNDVKMLKWNCEVESFNFLHYTFAEEIRFIIVKFARTDNESVAIITIYHSSLV